MHQAHLSTSVNVSEYLVNVQGQYAWSVLFTINLRAFSACIKLLILRQISRVILQVRRS